MRPFRSQRLPLLIAAAGLLAGCSGFPAFYESTSARPHPPPPHTGAQRDPASLREGIRLYDEGDYNAAIKRLSSAEISSGPVGARLTALKFTAFSYCVTSRPAQCQHAFESALKLDPSFDLARGEHGHPLWEPVFARARNARQP